MHCARSCAPPWRRADMAPVVEADGLVKRYEALTAVDGVSFSIEPGRIYALVGPNGSGKTSTVECLQGLRRPDAGKARLLGLDPQRDHDRLWRRVGVVFQETSYHNRIRLGEAIWLHESFYAQPLDGARLLEAFGLAEKRDTFFCRLSGGQQLRFLILLAMLGDPELLILDEPTTGLDPQARANVWEVLRGMRDRGASVLITTHQLDEAEAHCDIAAVMDRGRLLCSGAPADLLDEFGMHAHVVLPEHVAAGSVRAAGATQLQTAAGRMHVFGRGEEFMPAI